MPLEKPYGLHFLHFLSETFRYTGDTRQLQTTAFFI